MNTKIIIIFACFIGAAIYVAIDSKRKHAAKIEKMLKNSWGKPSKRKYSEDQYENIAHYFEDCADKGGFVIDDITWNDLNMDSIFKMMNITNSSVGQEYLYKMLRMPCNDNKQLEELDKLADFFDSHEKERMNVQRAYVKLGFAKHIAISDYIGLLVDLKAGSNLIHYVSLLFMLVSFAVCFAANASVGIGLVVLSVSFSIITYYRYKAKVEPYFICVTQLVKMVETAERLAQFKYTELADYNQYFKKCAADFSDVIKNAALLASSNVNGSLAEMLLDYVRMLTHVDLIKFNNMIRLLGNREAQVYELMEHMGRLEASISVASFRRMLPYWCRPDLNEHRGAALEVSEIYHPMIKEPVANSLKADKHILLTGSNASGKSTFLKTVAINALLSQAICTSISKSYKAPFFRIYSSMSLRDDLSSSNSYYIVEIKSLKRILDAVEKKGAPVLCFVDEVLRGTNTVERIAASSEILKSLRYQNVLCFAATHDIELTAILEKYYDNYHFQEEVTNDDVQFNYRLFKGPATTRNAIKLLNIIGYDKEIIDAAQRQAGYFIEHGIWKM